MDSEYETRNQRAVPRSASQPDNGYTYWADGQGWQNQPGAGAPNTPGYPATPAYDPNATSFDNTRGGAGFGAAGVGFGAPAGDPTAVYRGGAPGAGGPGFYGGSGGQPGQGGQGGGRFGLGSISGGINRMTGGINRMTGGIGRGGNGNGGFNLPFGYGGSGGGPKGPHVPGKGDWWRHWTWKKAGIVAGGSVAFFALALFSGYQYELNTTTIPVAAASETAQNSTVYYSDGKTVMGTIGDTNRTDLTLAQMGATGGATSPAVDGNLIDAFLAAEDKSFYTEGGISYEGILRALGHDVVTGGTNLNGGSTITEEYVKNAFELDPNGAQTTSIKLKEIFVAQKLAGEESKQTILDGFLNTVGLGENANGVQAAAETYFGKSAPQLSLAQDAVLASFPQAPSLLPQESDKSGLEFRWNYVITHMYSDGFITQAVEQQTLSAGMPSLLTWADPGRANTLQNINPGTNSSCPNATTSCPWQSYILSEVEGELEANDNISGTALETGGYKIVTNISLPMEKQMYNSVNDTLSSANLQAEGASVSSRPSWARVGAEVEDPATGAIQAIYPGPGQNMSDCSAWDCQDNISLAREQVGSSFKPYVLSAAVAAGMNVQTSTLDTSPYMCIATDNGGPGSATKSIPITKAVYTADSAKTPPSCAELLPGGFPLENDGGELIGKGLGTMNTGVNKGAVYYSDTPQDAMAASSNTGFSDLAHTVGTANVAKMAESYGVNVANFPTGSDLQHEIGEANMALGIASLTVNEQTQMIATIDDGGTFHEAHLVKSWQVNGTSGSVQTPTVPTHQVLSQAEDSQVEYAMNETATAPDGTATGQVTLDRPMVSKTGTTSAEHNGFYVGAIPQLAMVVTIDTDTNSPHSLLELGGPGTGGFWPAKIWNSFMTVEANNMAVEQLPTPQFTGSAWDQMDTPLPTVCKTKQNQGGKHGNKFQQQTAQNCPTPNATSTNGASTNNNGSNNNPFGNNNNGQPGNTNNGSTTNNGTPTPTQTVSCDPTTDVDCTDNNGILSCQVGVDNSCTAVTPTSTATPTTTITNNGGGAFGGAVLVPGTSLLLGFSSRKRRREIGRRLKHGKRKAE
jgi:membrane peptidoglycan carboxypeptidase